jgi:hypothetical protein
MQRAVQRELGADSRPGLRSGDRERGREQCEQAKMPGEIERGPAANPGLP